jgi:thiol-disulfide isomerase/thioredoxin
MQTNFFIVHAEWCPHCVTLMNTIETLAKNKSNNGEYNVNETMVRAIEQKELNNPEIKKILEDRVIEGFPTILVRNTNGFDEYNGSRDESKLLELFSNDKNIKKTGGRPIMRRRRTKTRRKTGRKRKRKTVRKRKRKTVSWLF